MRRIFSFICFCTLCLFTWLMFQIIFPYTSGRTDIDFLLSKQAIIQLKHYRWSFYLHIFSSLFVLAAGQTQFSSYALKHWTKVHRWIGKIYVFIILFISGPAALIMAFYANGGWISKCSFIILSLFWWFSTFRAYTSIRSKKIQAHRAWMIRSYALTLSAITLRIMQFGIAYWGILPPEDAYQAIASPSWLLNWGIAELIIWRGQLSQI